MQKKTIEQYVEGFNADRTRVAEAAIALEGFEEIPGSLTKHQAWVGGYRDHVTEIMNIAGLLYVPMSQARELPFTLNDALFTLFLHDLDKLFSFRVVDGTFERVGTYEEAHAKMDDWLESHGYALSAEEKNALKYVHGEGKDHNPDTRVQEPLAAFIHCCDTISARVWFDYGQDRKTW